MVKQIFNSLLVLMLFVCIFPNSAHAVIQNLNGQTGQNQSFVNDSNVTINSVSNLHNIIWTGVLSVSKGGTGNSSFANGSIPFIDSGSFTDNNSSLFWDNLNSGLGIGTNSPQGELHIKGDSFVLIDDGMDLILKNSEGATGGQNILFNDYNGAGFGQISFEPVESGFFLSFPNQNGGLAVSRENGNSLIGDTLDFWPPEGTLQVVEGNNSTLYVGSSISSLSGQKPGCIVIGDSDGSGVTYLTANDGVLSANTTKPSICQ